MQCLMGGMAAWESVCEIRWVVGETGSAQGDVRLLAMAMCAISGGEGGANTACVAPLVREIRWKGACDANIDRYPAYRSIANRKSEKTNLSPYM